MWNYNYYNDNELYHHGIKGMKWGVRRTPAQLGHKPSKLTTSQRKSEMKKMSDTELRNRINRIQMEKQYMQLTAPEVSAGKKFVKDVLVNAAKQTATSYVSKYMNKGLEAVMKELNRKG